MKKSLVWLLLILGFSASAQGVYPHQFTELTNLTDSNWETYTQKSGLPRRITPANMSAYFLKGVRAYVSGDVLYFSRRDSISSVDLSSYKQSLSVAQNGSGQTTITISDGNTITLPAATVGDIEVESPLEGIGTTGDPITVADLGITTGKIADNAVTFAKIQTIPTATLMGRYGSGTGAVQSITLGSGLSLSIGGELSATNVEDGNGIYDGSGTLPTDTVKVTNSLRFKLKDPSNSNGTTFFNRTKSAYSFIPDSYTDSLNQGFLIKKGVDSAAVAIDKDGNLQILSDEWVTIGNTQTKIIVRDDDPGVVFRYGSDGYTIPNQTPSNTESMGTFHNLMAFNNSGSSKWVSFETELRARFKRDTFITVPHSTSYIPNLVIDEPSRFYHNIYMSCKGITDTSVVAFLSAPTSDHYGVVYNIKNDSGLVETRILSDAHSSNLTTTYLLERGQIAQVRAVKDQANSNAYRWAINLIWDRIESSSVSEYDVPITSANSGSKLRISATSTGVTASFASNKLTIVIPSGVKVFSADWRMVSADVQSTADAGTVTNWVQVEFQGTGGNTGIDDMRIPNVQKTSIPTSGSLSVSNPATVDIDNAPSVAVVAVGSSNITMRVGGLSVGAQGYHLKFVLP